MNERRRMRSAALLAGGVLVLLGVPACGGGDDFENKPRPPVPLQLTGVITEQRVTISPNQVGAGPIVLVVSNQTDDSHTVTLDGEEVEERVGPINPLDTATIQTTLKQGEYEVRAGSSQAVAREIRPGTLAVGASRTSASDQLLLP